MGENPPPFEHAPRLTKMGRSPALARLWPSWRLPVPARSGLAIGLLDAAAAAALFLLVAAIARQGGEA